jgi:hypothetical protein
MGAISQDSDPAHLSHTISPAIIYDTNILSNSSLTNFNTSLNDPTIKSTNNLINDQPSVIQQRTLHQQILPQFSTKKPKPNDTWGSTISTPPHKSTRLYFQNINGLQLQRNLSRWQSHLQYMKETGTSIWGLAETNTNWSLNHIRKSIQHQSKMLFPNCSLSFSNNRFQTNTLPSHAPPQVVLH